MKIRVRQRDIPHWNSGSERSRSVRDWRDSVLRLVYPVRCPVCDEIVADTGQLVCPECEPRLKLLLPPWCMKCGKKVEEGEELCLDCRTRQHLFVRGRSLYEYGSAAASLYRFKYGNRQEYAAFFGSQAADYLGDYIRRIHPDGLVPIPLHPSRENKRGYNQAKLLAQEIGERLEIPVLSDYLVRVKKTVPLKHLNPVERQNNLKKAFIISKNDVKLKVIILIDDIYTTGATMDEAAKVCLAAGVEKVYCLSLACGAGV